MMILKRYSRMVLCWGLSLFWIAAALAAEPVIGSAGITLAQGEIAYLEPRAEAGDLEAAARLTHHFALLGDIKHARLFAECWAAGGDPNALYSLAFLLKDSADVADRTRAIQLLEQAEAKGLKLATSLLKELRPS